MLGTALIAFTALAATGLVIIACCAAYLGLAAWFVTMDRRREPTT